MAEVAWMQESAGEEGVMAKMEAGLRREFFSFSHLYSFECVVAEEYVAVVYLGTEIYRQSARAMSELEARQFATWMVVLGDTRPEYVERSGLTPSGSIPRFFPTVEFWAKWSPVRAERGVAYVPVGWNEKAMTNDFQVAFGDEPLCRPLDVVARWAEVGMNDGLGHTCADYVKFLLLVGDRVSELMTSIEPSVRVTSTSSQAFHARVEAVARSVLEVCGVNQSAEVSRAYDLYLSMWVPAELGWRKELKDAPHLLTVRSYMKLLAWEGEVAFKLIVSRVLWYKGVQFVAESFSHNLRNLDIADWFSGSSFAGLVVVGYKGGELPEGSGASKIFYALFASLSGVDGAQESLAWKVLDGRGLSGL